MMYNPGTPVTEGPRSSDPRTQEQWAVCDALAENGLLPVGLVNAVITPVGTIYASHRDSSGGQQPLVTYHLNHEQVVIPDSRKAQEEATEATQLFAFFVNADGIPIEHVPAGTDIASWNEKARALGLNILSSDA